MAVSKNYLQLEFGSGKFFEYSKEEKAGHEKHTSSKGNVSYRKYYNDGVEGVLDSASIYEGKFGNQISLNIKNGEEVYYVPVDINDQRGNIDTFAESLIKVLPSLNKGDNIAIRAYNFTPEGEKFAKIGISVKVDGVKIKGLTNAYVDKGTGKPVAGDIPALVWKKDALGKNKPSAVSLEAKDDYLLGVLKAQTDRLKWVGSAQGEQAAPLETPKKEFKPAVDSSEDDDDLPF